MVPPCVTRFRKRGKPNNHAPKKQATVVLPRKLKPYERYFAALLRSPAGEFLESAFHEDASAQLWTSICQRIRVPPLNHPIESKYSDEHKHFAARAALVLEESRCAIADGLAKRWSPRSGKKNNATPKPSRATMIVTCQSARRNEETNHTILKLQLSEQGRFNKEQLFHLRPGTVMEVLPRDQPRTIENVLLGCIMAGNREEIERECCFPMMIFRSSNEATIDKEFELNPIAGLISELRQFDACTDKKTKKVPFLTSLLGHWPKHTRFHYDDDDTEEEEEELENVEEEEGVRSKALNEDDNPQGTLVEEETKDVIDDIFDCLECSSEDGLDENESVTDDDEESTKTTESPTMIGTQLNKTQEEVASKFLGSSPGTITLVQGPPGTGKSTLLVAIICRYLMAASDASPPRLLVSAPTNKAVTVVATRFLKALNGTEGYNVIMVGDAEKLLDSEEPMGNGASARESQSSLRSIFIYSWMACMIDEYRRLHRSITQKRLNRDEMYSIASRLHRKLLRQLPFSAKGEIASLSRKVVKALKQRTKGDAGDAPPSTGLSELDDLICKLGTLRNEDVCQELLNSANVIFSTLASTGAVIFKWTPKVNDLIVDEAAAATEPLLYIPFHLRPRRLLVVGDPLQLPATVMSKRAMALGYDKSLHERLMHDCQCPYTMLDVQYRMKPEISSFPSSMFYQGKIMNGDNVKCPMYSNPQLKALSTSPYSFMQVDGKEEQAICGSYRNLAEAHQVVELIHNLQVTSSNKDSKWHGVDRIRIITFYRAQVVLLQQLLNRRGLPRVLVATVDSSQGCEAELIIVSFVRSNNGHRQSPGFAAGFLTDDRRVNVALTRAKFQLICVGNVQAMTAMTRTSTLFGLASNAGERKCIVAATRDISSFPSSKSKRQRVSSQQSGSKRRTEPP